MPVYRLSSKGLKPQIIEALAARDAVRQFVKTTDASIEVTCEGPEVTTVWRASKFGQRVVRWSWNQETKSA
jgi:hypothetical protein